MYRKGVTEDFLMRNAAEPCAPLLKLKRGNAEIL